MNTITAAELLKKKNEIYNKNSNVPTSLPLSSRQTLARQDTLCINDEESLICEKPLRPVSDMNTFKRKLNHSLRQTILPQQYENQTIGRMQTAAENPRRYEYPLQIQKSARTNKPFLLPRRDTVFEKPDIQANENLDLVFSPTRSKIRKRSQSHMGAQTDKLSIDMNDMYSIFDVKKKQEACRTTSIKCILFTTAITAYSIGLLAFQYYVLNDN